MANEKRLIDANKVINAMQKCLDEEPDKKGTVAFFAFESIIECLKQEPTVDAVEVVHGRWEDGCAYFNGRKVYDSIDCSSCEGVFKIESETREYWKEKYKWCPFCGAKMDGDGNEI